MLTIPSSNDAFLQQYPVLSNYLPFIHHPSSSQVLSNVAGTSKWLPGLYSEKHGYAHVHDESSHLESEIKNTQHIQFDLIVLPCVTYEISLMDRYGDVVVRPAVALEAYVDTTTAPSGKLWGELQRSELATNVAKIIDSADLCDQMEMLDPAFHLPFAHRGSSKACIARIELKLHNRNLSPICKVEQLCCTWRGRTLIVPTADESVYYAKCCLKCTSEIETHDTLRKLFACTCCSAARSQSRVRMKLTSDIGQIRAPEDMRSVTEGELWLINLSRFFRKLSTAAPRFCRKQVFYTHVLHRFLGIQMQSCRDYQTASMRIWAMLWARSKATWQKLKDTVLHWNLSVCRTLLCIWV